MMSITGKLAAVSKESHEERHLQIDKNYLLQMEDLSDNSVL